MRPPEHEPDSDSGRNTREAKGRGWIPWYERTLSYWKMAILLLGVVSFLLGTVVDLSMPERGPNGLLLTGLRSLSELLRSLGIAAVISIIISDTVERSNRSGFFSAVSEKTRELTENVFWGMFNRRHPPALLEEVRGILDRKIVRDSVDVTYTLSLWRPPPGLALAPGRSFVQIDVIVAIAASNVSTLNGMKAGNEDVEVSVGLSALGQSETNAFVKITKVIVGGEVREADELIVENRLLQADLATAAYGKDVWVRFGKYSIRPGGTLNTSASYTMIKDLQDTEVFQTMQIARKLSLSVYDNTNGALEVIARVIASQKLDNLPSGANSTRWQINDVLLPEQGIAVSWRPRKQEMLG